MYYSKMINRLILTILCLLASGFGSNAQYNPQYSQYMFNGLAINPAFAGSMEALNVSALYRGSQLGNSVKGAPVTQTLAGDFQLRNPQLAIGMMIFNDQIHTLRNTGAYFAYVFRVRVGEGKLSFGLQAGVEQQREANKNLILVHSDDPLFRSDVNKIFMLNVGAGTYYYTPKFFAGLSFPQISEINSGKLIFSPKLYGGTIFSTDKDLKIKPSTLVQYSGTGVLWDLNCNFLLMQERLELGASWRNAGVFVAMVQFKYNNFTIGYAHDYAIGKPNAINTTHEIMLRYDLNIRVNAMSTLFL